MLWELHEDLHDIRRQKDMMKVGKIYQSTIKEDWRL